MRELNLSGRSGHESNPPAAGEKPHFAHKALHLAPITFLSREIHLGVLHRLEINRFTETGNDAGSVLSEIRKVT
jgi:hypothetical protein